MTLKLGIQVLNYHQCFQMTLGWPWPFLWQGQICFLMLLYGWQLIQHWVLMYFQVCSNSAYPQHSGERYRTNGPLAPPYCCVSVLPYFICAGIPNLLKSFTFIYTVQLLYPQHLCRGVCSFCLSVRMFVEFTSKFYVKVSPSGYISSTTHQKAFIFGPRVLGGSTFLP